MEILKFREFTRGEGVFYHVPHFLHKTYQEIFYADIDGENWQLKVKDAPDPGDVRAHIRTREVDHIPGYDAVEFPPDSAMATSFCRWLRRRALMLNESLMTDSHLMWRMVVLAHANLANVPIKNLDPEEVQLFTKLDAQIKIRVGPV